MLKAPGLLLVRPPLLNGNQSQRRNSHPGLALADRTHTRLVYRTLHIPPWAGRCVGALSLQVSLMRSPPLLPAFDFETCVVLDDFGRFQVYCETDENEVDRETVIRNIINGLYEKPVRVVVFNTAGGWSSDIAEDIGHTKSKSGLRAAEPMSQSAQSFVGKGDG
jgi:hypothetical protein